MGKKSKQQQQPVEAVVASTSATQLDAPKPASFDTELDALFTKAKQQPPASVSAPQSRKKASVSNLKAHASAAQAVSADSSDGEDDDDEDDEDAELDLSAIVKEMEDQGFEVGSVDEELRDDEADAEDARSYSGEKEEEEVMEVDEEDDSAQEADDDSLPPVHESLTKEERAERRIRRKLEAREEETKEVRDKRSLFIGNVPIACVQSKALTKELKRHIAALSPYPSLTRIEALRYRSVAFSVPTADFAAGSQAEAASGEKRRARSRAFKDALDAADGKNEGKVYLNPKQKRKVAFITQDINEKAKSVNAYVTLDKLSDAEIQQLRAKTGCNAKQAAKLTAQVLAALLATRVDDTVLEGRHLRADLATSLAVEELASSGLDKTLSQLLTQAPESSLCRILSGGKSKEDQSRTLFVGNLDFEADEEDLRAMLEGTVIEERGQPPSETTLEALDPLGEAKLDFLPPFEHSVSSEASSSSSSILASLRRPTWVQSVRIVRDSATQMGKGFGYVRFMDEACVDEIMAIWEADEAFLTSVRGGGLTQGKGKRKRDEDGLKEDGARKDFKRRLKLNKRPLRVARCKNVGGGSTRGKGKGRPTSRSGTDSAPSSSDLTTPNKSKDSSRRRSMGAPTPGGTSPSSSVKKSRLLAPGGSAPSSPSRPPTLAPAPSRLNGKPSSSSSSTRIPNPGPAQPRSAEQSARLALKRADPERMRKRMEKKERKRVEVKSGVKKGQGLALALGKSKEGKVKRNSKGGSNGSKGSKS